MMLNDPITRVCVLTGRGMSAIASVALRGGNARGILSDIFKKSTTEAPNGSEGMEARKSDRVTAVPRFCQGDVVYGSIVEGDRVIDEVLVGCEGDERFVIHCHGNPLLVEQIVRLCQANGAELVDAESFAFQRHAVGSQNAVEAEAKLAMQQSATLLGVKILQSQIDGGLSRWACDVLKNFDTTEISTICQQAERILDRSRIAKRIIDGVRIVIAGPPNSGKSTLLNCLSGRDEVIVSDTAGTTRDWVSVTCRMGPIRAEFIDTAGLDDVLAGKDNIEQTAQEITKGLLESCDLIVYVTDVTDAGSRQEAAGRICPGKPVVWVANKGDLVQEYKDSRTHELSSDRSRAAAEDGKPHTSSLKPVRISARENVGIDQLADAILNRLQIDRIAVGDAIIFTSRQLGIVSKLSESDDQTIAENWMQQLLHPAD